MLLVNDLTFRTARNSCESGGKLKPTIKFLFLNERLNLDAQKRSLNEEFKIQALLDAPNSRMQPAHLNMNPFRILALLAISGGLSAFVGQAATLATDSPFLKSETTGAQSNVPSAEGLELRGVMSGNFGYLYYVYDSVKKKGVWAGSNDTEFSFRIIAADAAEGYLDIRTSDGRLLHLKMRESKISVNGVAAAGLSPVTARLTETQAAWREEFQQRVAENASEN